MDDQRIYQELPAGTGERGIGSLHQSSCRTSRVCILEREA
jgi:hypothetical protein